VLAERATTTLGSAQRARNNGTKTLVAQVHVHIARAQLARSAPVLGIRARDAPQRAFTALVKNN
jgi:hypothetical protein